MAYFPMFVCLDGKKCLIVGAGKVAARKAAALLDFGADVKVVAPAIGGEMEALRDSLRIEKRGFRDEDLDENVFLVVAAADDRELNHRVALLARRQKIPVDSATDKEDCSFLFPSVIRRGEAVIGISSSGTGPAVTGQLKKRIESCLPEDLGEKLDILGRIRSQVKAEVKSQDERTRILREAAADLLNGDRKDKQQ